MREHKRLDNIKKEYMNIEIPENLDFVVDKALNKNKKTSNRKIIKYISTAAACFAIVVATVNFSPTVADALEDIPVVDNIINVITFKNYRINEEGVDVSIKVPHIDGLEDKELQYKMNSEFEKQGKEIYNQYLDEISRLKAENKKGNESFSSWYEIKNENKDVISLVVYNYSSSGSSNTERTFYNIDKNTKTALTLEGMFAGTDYIDAISANIKEQMRNRMKTENTAFYFVDTEDGFKSIDKNQDFYINADGEIVICFDKYEVAPGSQGVSEFTIPSSVTDKLLK
ncbi:anti-sigma-V factor rsiV [Peptacetobacter hominis]|uniref:Anti-sigma-V factor rsiV n=1 Tax=Peptacetobacter hominis TaxID=2743610 RepID=A0A544QXM3_9FIRM|nr:anti-sigma-V factor rsiV [Peptacetobacter hominis]TQQ85512.1 anti-sigma-V factor rsiV [Peptacetobacter hominis]